MSLSMEKGIGKERFGLIKRGTAGLAKKSGGGGGGLERRTNLNKNTLSRRKGPNYQGKGVIRGSGMVDQESKSEALQKPNNAIRRDATLSERGPATQRLSQKRGNLSGRKTTTID